MGENLEVVGREMSRCSRREPQRVSTSWKEEKKDERDKRKLALEEETDSDKDNHRRNKRRDKLEE